MSKQLTESTYQRLISDISKIYEQAKSKSVQAVDKITTQAYWDIGKRIVQDEQNHNIRAEYGLRLLENLSADLTSKYGSGFSSRNLSNMRVFYQAYPILQAPAKLDWTHYQILSTIQEKEKRRFYENRILKFGWSSRQLVDTLKRDKIKLQDFRLKKLPHKQSQPIPKLTLTRGRLYTYRLIKPKHIKSIRSGLLIDCGFSLWREMPLRGINNPCKGDIVESISAKIRGGSLPVGQALYQNSTGQAGANFCGGKTEEGFRFKHSQAKKNQLYTYKAFVEKVTDADTICPPNLLCKFGETSPKSYVLYIYFN